MTSPLAAATWTAPAAARLGFGVARMPRFRDSLADIGTSENRRRTETGGKRGDRLRAPGVRTLIAAALAVSLLLGGAFLVMNTLRPSPSETLDHPVNPVTDDATAAQVIESAKQIVSLTGLQTKSAGYLLMSCKNQYDPPYQGAIYLTFTLPAGARADTYFTTIAATLVTRGWTEGLPPNEHAFGKTVSKDAVTAIIYPHGDDPSVGVLRAYGQCRDVNDHRRDGWIDITNQFPRAS